MPTRKDHSAAAAAVKRSAQTYFDRREAWVRDGNVSVPLYAGKLVIALTEGRASNGEYPLFEAEGERLRRLREASGRYGRVMVLGRAGYADLDELFADPTVAALEIVGHGAIGRVWTTTSRPGRGVHYDYTWLDAARAATHLKAELRQAMCAHFPVSDPLCIPLGAMVVAHLPNNTAATGCMIPTPLGRDREHLFAPVFASNSDPMGQVEALNAEYRGNVYDMDDDGVRTIHIERGDRS